MTDNEARKALRDAAKAFATRMPDVARGKGRAYEAWVMLALARRLVAKRYVVEATDSTGKPVRKLRLRKNPAPMPDVANAASSPCHLVISRGPYRRFELHLGMQHEGTSSALHEVDLSIVPAEPAEALRQAGGGPWQGPTCFALELKCYAEDATLDLGIGRALVGVAYDLDPLRSVNEIEVMRSRKGSKRFTADSPPTRLYIVTSAGLYRETERLLAGHHGKGYASVIPKSNEGPLDKLLEDMIDQCFCWW